MPVSSYRHLLKNCRKNNSKLFPSYEKVLKAKQECYPPNLTISDFKMEVPLQNLLDHTVQRLLILQKEALEIARISNREVPLGLILVKNMVLMEVGDIHYILCR